MPTDDLTGSTLTGDHRRAMEAVFQAGWRDHRWPTFAQVDRPLLAEGIDAQHVLGELAPAFVRREGVGPQFRPDEHVKLSLPGVAQTSGRDTVIPLFLSVLAFLVGVEANHLVEDGRFQPEVNRDDLISHLSGARPRQVAEEMTDSVRLVLLEEPAIWESMSGPSAGGDGSWSLHLSREIRRYAGVTTFEEYLLARPSLQHRGVGLETAVPTEGSVVIANAKKVFVIHGRNENARRALFDFLRAIGLDPIEWSEAIRLTGEGSPYIGHVLDAAFAEAQAVVVLETPDDVAYLHQSLAEDGDPESKPQMQPRPNVLFEAGMAMGRDAARTIIVELGVVKAFSDIHGRHVVRLDNTVRRRQELAERLRTAGCDVQLAGSDWHDAGDLTPPARPGEGLPLGRRLPSSEASGTPRLQAKYVDNGPSRFADIVITNLGPGEVFELNATSTDSGLRSEDSDLPIARLPQGKSIRVPYYLNRALGHRSPSHFYLEITGMTADGTAISVEEYVGIEA